jgi:histone H1/5
MSRRPSHDDPTMIEMMKKAAARRAQKNAEIKEKQTSETPEQRQIRLSNSKNSMEHTEPHLFNGDKPLVHRPEIVSSRTSTPTTQHTWSYRAKSVRKAKKSVRKAKKSVRKTKKSVRKTKKSARK